MAAMRTNLVRCAGLAVLFCGLAAWGQAYTPVTIVVTDPGGAAVGGAYVKLTPGTTSGENLITDEHGSLSVGLSPGKYHLRVTAQGYSASDRDLDIQAKAQTITVALNSGHVVAVPETGMAMEMPTAKPVSADTLIIEGATGQRGVFTPATLKDYPHQTVTIFDHHTNASETYSGVPLMDLLSHLGVPHGKELMGKVLADYIVATGSDGYKSVVALGEVDPEFHPGMVLIADAMDGKPLDKTGPFRLVVTEDKRPARSVRNLVRIELRTAE